MQCLEHDEEMLLAGKRVRRVQAMVKRADAIVRETEGASRCLANLLPAGSPQRFGHGDK